MEKLGNVLVESPWYAAQGDQAPRKSRPFEGQRGDRKPGEIMRKYGVKPSFT